MSKNLVIKIDSTRKTIVFSGDTFLYKDQIKTNFKSKWNSTDKTWQASYINEEQVNNLPSIFPLSQILFLQKEVSEVVCENLPSVNKDLESGSSSVSQLLIKIKKVISNSFPTTISVFGVLSSVKKLSNGRIYFDLLDSSDSSTIRCILWESKSSILDELSKSGIFIEDNTPVLLEGSLTLGGKNGSISFVVDRFVPEYTLGKIQANREKTNEALKKEGLFNKNKSTKLAFLPMRLGLLTSDSGTVINDFMASIKVSDFGYKLYWYHTRVQGDFAKNDIISGISFFNKNKNVDAILIFRGGGSVTDLQIFNDYEISKAVCLSVLPILSAIGHEHDQSSIQDVSYKSFGVPKDLGRFFSDLILNIKDDLKNTCLDIHLSSSRYLDLAERDISLLSYRIHKEVEQIFAGYLKLLNKFGSEIKKIIITILETYNNKYLRSVNSIDKGLNTIINQAAYKLKSFKRLCGLAVAVTNNFEKNLSLYETIFNNLSPETQLKRGFAIIRNNKNHQTVVDVSSIGINDNIIIEMIDGEIQASVKNKHIKVDYEK